MRLPGDPKRRHDLIVEIGRQCSVSRSSRQTYHRQLRDYYVRGSATQNRARFNKIKAHVRQSSAYLFQSESVRFGLVAPAKYGDTFDQELEAASNDFHRFWHDSRSGLVLALGVKWAHVYPSVIWKVVATGGSPALYLVPDPADVGVREEDKPFDSQEAMVHFYTLDLSAFRRLVEGHPKKDDLLRLALMHAQTGGFDAAMGATVERMVFDQQGPSGDAVYGGGSLVQAPAGLSEAQVDAPRVLMCEVWVVDDAIDDWRSVICLAPAGARAVGHGPVHPVDARRRGGLHVGLLRDRRSLRVAGLARAPHGSDRSVDGVAA